MSKTIDEKVVEMRFDNKNFEQNVKQSMSTLDKLKQKLNLTGASKGLENINKASNKVDMKGMSSAIEGVQSKFSALEVMGITALANITNSAVNAGKRIVSALTIDPITTGFQEYETQINAIQTILANTQKEGTNVEIVNKALDELNKYADMTIYNFTEMTRNIGTFTAAGVKLDTSVKAIKGIANLAAVSGSNAQQASTAMYQLSQALASGTVKLMDWNSVVNAGMGGQVFQDALKETARVHGIAIDQIIKEQGSFRDSLHTGWLTAEILTETLEKFTLSTENMTEAEIQANRERLKSIGYTDEQIDGIFKLGKTATDAATKVKTFSQLWGTMKEAAQSGWAQTWRIIIGDFEEAKELLTSISNFFTGDNGVITKMNNSRNALLNGALGKGFEKLKETLNTIVKPVKTVTESVSKVTGALEDLDAMVTKVIRGEFGNGKARFKALTEAGYNYYAIQNKVNEKLGDSFRYSEKLTGAQKELNKTQEETAEVQAKLAGSEEERLEQLAKMTDAELESLGLTKEQIDALRELQKYVDMTGLSFKDFLDNIDQLNGRWLLINSFKNIGSTLVGVFNPIGKAWKDVFPPMQAERLFEIIAGFHKLTLSIKEAVTNEETLDKLTRTLRGLFSILGFITDLVGGGFKLAFNILKTVLSTVANLFGFTTDNILDFTASIGDAIYNARKWIKDNSVLTKIIEGIVVVVVKAVQALGDWIKNNEVIQNAISNVTSRLKELGDAWSNWIEGLKETDNVPKYILEGLVNGFKNIGGAAAKAIIAFGQGLIEAFKNILGIHSPSTVFMAIGGFIIAGLLLGITGGFNNVFDAFKSFGAKCIELIKSFDFGKLLAMGVAVGLVLIIKNIIDVAKNLTGIINKVLAPLQGFGNLLTDLGNAAKNWGKAKKFDAIANIIKSIGVSIALLAASLFVLSKVDSTSLWSSVGALSALVAVIGAVTVIVSKLSKTATGAAIKTIPIVSMAASLFMLALTLKQISSIPSDRMLSSIGGLVAIIAALGGLMIAIGKTINPKLEKNLDKVGKMIRKISTSLLLLTVVVKLASMLSEDDMKKGVGFMTVFALFIAGFTAIGRLAGKNSKSADKIGKMISKISVSLLLMVGVVKLSSMLSEDDIKKGVGVIAGIGLIFAALVGISHLAGDNANKAGTMILALSGAMVLAVGAIAVLSLINQEDLNKSLSAITMIGIIFGALIAVSSKAGPDAIKAGVMLAAISGALVILSGVIFILGNIDIGQLTQGLVAVTILEALFGALIYISKFAGSDVVKTIVSITASIAVLVVALIALANLKVPNLVAAIAGLTSVMVGLGALMIAANKLGDTEGILKIYALLPIIVILAAVVGVLSSIAPESSIQTALSLSALMLAMVGVLAILNTIKITNGILTPLLALTGIIILSLGLVFALNQMSGVENALANALALSVLATTLTALLIPLAILGAIITGTGGIGAMAIVAGIASLAGMLVPLGLIAALLWAMSGIENATANAKLLTDLLTVLTDTLVKISLIAPLAILGVAALSGLALIMTALGVLAVGIGALMTKFPAIEQFLNTGIPILVNLANGVGQMVGAFVSGIMTSIASGLPEIGLYLSQFMLNATPFITGAKMIDESVIKGITNLAGAILALTAADIISGIASFLSGGSTFSDFGNKVAELGPGLKQFSDSVAGIDAIQVQAAAEAAKALAEMCSIIPNEGGVVAWFTGENSISKFGTDLVVLGTSLAAFSVAVAGIDTEQIKGAAEAGKALAEMASVIPNEGGVVSWFTGDNSISKFGPDLVKLGEGLKSFANSVKGMDTEQVKGAAEAAKSIAEMASVIPNEGGVVAWFTGDNSISKFGQDLIMLGTGLLGFSIATEGINAATVSGAVSAAILLAKMTEYMPSEGGVKAWIFGEQSISKFGSDLIALGNGLLGFSIATQGINPENLLIASQAAKYLGDMCEHVPYSEGLAAWLVGEQSISKFASELPALGAGLLGFSNSINGMNPENVSAAAIAAKSIAEMCNIIPKEGGLQAWFEGEQSISSFAEKLPTLGAGLLGFSNSVNGISAENITAASNAAKTLAEMASTAPEDTSKLTGFGDNLKTFSEKIKEYFSNTSGITSENVETANKAITSIKDLANLNIGNVNTLSTSLKDIIDSIKNLASIPKDTADSFNSALSELGKNGTGALLKPFDDLPSDMREAGNNALNSFVEGANEKQSIAVNKCKAIVSACITGIKNKFSDVETAGEDFVQGFANGINNNVDIAINAGSAVGRKALAAAKAAIDSDSPSKETFKLGTFFDQGFMLGIEKLRNKIYDSAYSTGNYAKSGLTKAISRISDVINGDIDTQPTIRPVLDLSGVESGVGYLSTMLSNGPSVGVKANLDSISYGMNAKVQNGVNGDVVSAIDKLRKDLGNTRGDTYNVNGITYDDGSNITEAVREIVRAAKVERRK